ncbi:uncharacterized protein LOC131857508 [Cryptomeria japonica]|uniref:uncharacterized protein LOC131857508 n=1 Tax=Cryptomeria japonica TaxID=3369 RepID=UPI0027DAA86E|nr:uncharacterized protein LOC131857508 [Cryptomeria japonica]
MAASVDAEPLPPQDIMATYPEPLRPILSSPRHVAFRGANNEYLGWTKGGFTKFIYDDLTNPFVKHPVMNEETDNGERYVHIKCCFNQKFWRRQDNSSWLILAGGRYPDRDRSRWSCTLFDRVYSDQDASVRLHLLQPSKLLAICETKTAQVRQHGYWQLCRSAPSDVPPGRRNHGREKFRFRREETDTGHHFFSPVASMLEEATLLKVRETVIQRKVHSVEYDLKNIEIYDEVPLLAATVVVSNKTTHAQTTELNLSRKVKNSRPWSNSLPYTTGIKGSFTMGVPSIGESGVEVSDSKTSTKEWGESEEDETTLGSNYSVTVKPGVKLTVLLRATQGKFSLKFSYVQEDVLSTGEQVKASKHDGLFTGVNYNVKINLSYHFTTSLLYAPATINKTCKLHV